MELNSFLEVVTALLSESYEVEVREQVVDLLNRKLHSPEMLAVRDGSILSLLGKIYLFRNQFKIRSLKVCVCISCFLSSATV